MRTLRVLNMLAIVGILSLPAALDAQVINEIRIDQPGTDNDEYFELFGSAGQSLTGLTYITIGDSGGGMSGVLEAVVDLSGTSIGASGFFVVAESSFSLGVADVTATLAFENSDNVTHLLVSGFTGASGDDLDTDDDGVLDSTPWTSILDCIGMLESATLPPTNTEYVYCMDTVGPDGTFVPGHIARSPDGTGLFMIQPFDPAAGEDTPGGPNQVTPPEDCSNGTDDDLDGDVDCADLDCECDIACVAGPANDDCISATAVGEGTFPFSNRGATEDGPQTCGGNLSKDVWFLFTAPCDGLTLFTTCGTASVNYNPQMAIYDATLGCPTSADWIVCDAGSCTGSGEPEILLDVVSGQSYYVQLGGFNGSCGDATLTITCPPADCHLDPNPNVSAEYLGGLGFSNAPSSPDITATGAADIITVSGIGTIQDLDVRVNATHPFVGDLVVDLGGPTGTQIRLHDAAGGGADDLDVIFDDEGATYDTVPFNDGSRMQPFDALTLAAYDGTNADGGWIINILDNFILPGDPARGTFDSWELIFFQPEPIPDNNVSGLVTTVEFPASITDGINDLDVNIELDHPDTSDLNLSLASPAGTQVTLHAQSAGVNVIGRYDDAGMGFNDGFGTLVPDGPGTLADYDGEGIAGTWTLTTSDTVASSTGTLSNWNVSICPSPCAPLTDLAGTFDCDAGTLTITWVNGQTYDSIDVLNGGTLIATIGGGDTTYIDTAPLEGFNEYTVIGTCAGGGSAFDDRFINYAGYNGEQHIILQLEGLIDFGDVGMTDSGAAVEAALIANGLSNIKRVSVDPDDYPCLMNASVESLWVCAGTFPTNYRLDTSEGDLIAAANAAGIAVYLESTDHWGFAHNPSLLDARDGVDDAIHDIGNGDDSFLGMDGLNSGNGLDLTAYQNISYTIDTDGTISFGDSNDQLQVATSDAEVSSAGGTWQLDDLIGIPYLTGIFSETTSGGDMLVQSWEFGGFGGDRNALMADYIAALLTAGPPVGSFDRGDCNADGMYNIADDIFLLANLFSGGPDGPCSDACDPNDDGDKNIADAIYGLANLFSGGPDPTPPFGACGADPTADMLDCLSFPSCP